MYRTEKTHMYSQPDDTHVTSTWLRNHIRHLDTHSPTTKQLNDAHRGKNGEFSNKSHNLYFLYTDFYIQ
jgi:hypothetical protein